ncbi:hypothetical protein H8E65_08925 [Candidatus Bathyarchaeota archaeon]|nr:hypothetical protein [Candidatus Bathyarchaeota archaeon]MBL7079149.1 hypothetical protein [Candidatus Bathyarchaeota archaeon]
MSKVSDRIDLKEIERRAYLSYHEDGLIDILIGLGLLAAGLYFYAGMFWLVGSMIAIYVPIYMSIKKRITFPRIGQVEFSKSRTGRAKNTYYFLVAINVVGVVVGFVFWNAFSSEIRPEWMYVMIDNYAIVLGIVGAFIFAVVAWITDLTRFHWYAALTLVSLGSANFIASPFIGHVVALGFIITVAGYLQLQKFKGKYPIVQEN